MSGFEVLERISQDEALAGVPVVVFTGRELSPEEDAQLHTLARSVVVKGVESPERLLDETSLFLHRVLSGLPLEKQRMLDRLHRSDEDLIGKAVLVVDDDVRNIFALSSVLERRGMKVLTASTGSEAIQTLETTPDVSMVLMDIMMPEMDGYQTMQKIREKPVFRRLADRGAHSEGDEGRPREMLRGWRVRLPGKACEHRTVAVGAPHVAASIGGPDMTSTTRIDRVNILLVDDQPAKLLSYVTILSSLGETLITVNSATEALECLLKNDIAVVLVDVCMPDLDGYELAAMIRQHPRFQQTAIIFVSAVMLNELEQVARLRMWGRRLTYRSPSSPRSSGPRSASLQSSIERLARSSV